MALDPKFELDLLREFKVSEAEIRQFKESAVWQVMKGELENRLTHNADFMASAPMDDIWGQDSNGRAVLERAGIRRLQGETLAIKIFLQYPDLMLADLKAEEEATNAGNE